MGTGVKTVAGKTGFSFVRDTAGIAGLLLFFLALGLYRRIPNLNFVIMLAGSSVLLAMFFYLFASKEEEKEYSYKYERKSILLVIAGFAISIIIAVSGLLLDIRKVLYLPHILWGASVFVPLYFIRLKQVEVRKLPKVLKGAHINIPPLAGLAVVLTFSILTVFLQKGYYFFYSVLTILLAAYSMGFFFNSNDFTKKDDALNRIDCIILGFVFIAAVFFRFFMINQVPPGYENQAREIFMFLSSLNDGVRYDVKNWPVQLFHDIYLTFFMIKPIGLKLENIRVVEVIFSIATIPFFFMLVKEMYDKKTAIFSTSFFSLLFMSVSMARMDMAVYRVVFYSVLSLYLLLISIKTGKLLLFVLTGIVVSLSAYGYPSGRLHVFVVVTAFLAYGVNVLRLGKSFKNFFNLFLTGFSSILIALPVLYYMFAERQFGIYAKLFEQSAKGADLVVEVMKNFTDVFFAIAAKGTEQFCFALPIRPFTVGIESVIIFAGIAYLIYGIREKRNATMLVWIFFSILPLVLYPFYYKLRYFRMIIFFGIMPIIMGLGMNVFYRMLSRILPKSEKILFYALLIGISVYSGFITFTDYFYKFRTNGCVRDAYASVGTEIEELVVKDRGKSFVFMSNFWKQTMLSSGFCLRCGKKVAYTDINTHSISMLAGKSSDLIIVAEGFYADYFDYLKEFFPGIRIDKVRNVYGEKTYVDPYGRDYLYVAVFIPGEDIENAAGLNISRLYADGRVENGKTVFPIETKGEKQIRLQGIIEAPEYARYVFSFGDSVKSEIVIDGKIFSGGMLSKGLHNFSAVLSGTIPQKISLKWAYAGKTGDIPANCVFSSGKVTGLRATYKYFLDERNTFTQIEPQLMMRLQWYNPRIKFESIGNQYTVIWQGYYLAEKDGIYSFDLSSFEGFCNNITVNGRKIVNYAKEIKENRSIYLSRGPNRIEVLTYSYLHIPDPALFYYRLMVKKPGSSEFEAVKYYELNPFKNN